MASSRNDNLAVLIDADNAQASVIHELLEEVSRYGTSSVKRAYGDWTGPGLTKWKKVLHELAIQPMQQFAYTAGKNATDSALIIDAMDLLHTSDLNGFCLVSSDSDFTRLATRLREAGLVVYGFGERKTPQAFVAACDKFIYTDILKPTNAKEGEEKPKARPFGPIFKKAFNAVAQEDGSADLSLIGTYLNKSRPDFDPRDYGYQKLSELVRKQKGFNVSEYRKEGASGKRLIVSRR